MKYDFTSIPDRSTWGSSKWKSAKNASVDAVPLSTADMEFPTAPPIVKALKNTVENAILGYTEPTDAYYDAVCSWMKRKHNFDIDKDWIVTTPGVVNALGLLIQASTKENDGVIILTPVYYPFDMAVLAKSRKFIYSELQINNGRYEIDYDDLEKKAALPEAKAIIFCNPHNPVGRVWTKDELTKVADICNRNGVFIIDDEIHNDLIMPGYTHTVMATVNDATKNNIAVCTAPSKTFNLAGLQCSNIIIPNVKVRSKTVACSLLNMQSHLNVFSFTACTAAYNECEDWLNELLKVIAGNAKYIEDYMKENFPEIKVFPLEGTYLQWLDLRGTGLTHVEQKAMLEKANIYLDNGEMFGDLGRGFQRINLACSRTTLEKTMARFKKAMEEVKADREKNGIPYHRKLRKGNIVEGFTYDSSAGNGLQLKDTLKKKTLIIFARYFECSICQEMLKMFKKFYNVFSLLGIDIKFVLQSPVETLISAQKDYPFELIADPDAKLYDRYNIFEANGLVNMVAGDKQFEKMIKGNIRNLLDTDLIDSFSEIITGSPDDDNTKKPRELQLCAFIGVNKDMQVIYSHYCKTIGDFPDPMELIRNML